MALKLFLILTVGFEYVSKNYCGVLASSLPVSLIDLLSEKLD